MRLVAVPLRDGSKEVLTYGEVGTLGGDVDFAGAIGNTGTGTMVGELALITSSG